jgi:hypothetical protein
MNGHEVAFEIGRLGPELMVTLLFDSDVPTHALALVDAGVPNLGVSRHFVRMIAELCSRSRDRHRNQGGFRQEDQR